MGSRTKRPRHSQIPGLMRRRSGHPDAIQPANRPTDPHSSAPPALVPPLLGRSGTSEEEDGELFSVWKLSGHKYQD